MKNFFLPCLLFFLCFLTACAGLQTIKTQYVGIDEKLLNREYDEALSQIESSKEKHYTEKEQVLYYLDMGLLCHYNNQYARSNIYLTKAEYAIEELFTKSISKAAASLLINDNILEYAGEDYEDIYINIFKAINYLELGKNDDAFVEIRRVNKKLLLLGDKYTAVATQYNTAPQSKATFLPGKNSFHDSALARYHSMLLYRNEGKFDDAHIDKKKLISAQKRQPNLYPFEPLKLENYLLETEKARLNVVAFTGRAPQKKASTLYIHTEKDHIIIADSEEKPSGKQALKDFDVIAWNDIEEGYHFKFQLPYMERQLSHIASVNIVVDSVVVGRLSAIESLENVAIETYKIKEPLIYLKTITRSIIKGLFAEKRKKELSASVGGGFLGDLTRLAADVAVDATENADLRSCRFFPALASVGEFYVSPGCHCITVQYCGSNGEVLWHDDLGVKNCVPGRLNFIESFYLN